jgi:predicted acetyltransferase
VHDSQGNSTSLRIERPSPERAESFAAMRDAFMSGGDDRWPRSMKMAHSDPVAYAEMLRGWSKEKSLPDGFVRADVFWIILNDIVVGECHVRHVLTPALEKFGGNIGYHVHPEYRNRGIATFALRAALGVAARIGMQEALLTCAPENGASIRVIEKFGSRRIDDTQHRRYLVPTRVELR